MSAIQWFKDHEKISPTMKSKRKGTAVEEKKLKDEFLEKRTYGHFVKMWWFRSRAKQLMRELYPTVENVKCSDHRMRLFFKRLGYHSSAEKLTFHK